MIRYILHFCSISHLFVSKHAEPIIGENVWPANPQDFTFMASLGLKKQTSFMKRNHFCGGSLITKCYVLTAAHCLRKYSVSQVDVIIGEVNLAVPSPKYNVSWWITYNRWAKGQRRPIKIRSNDIAIVAVKILEDRPVIKPVVLTYLNGERLYGTSAVIAGWGVTNTGSKSYVLLRARVTILTHEECARKIKLIMNECYPVKKNLLCSWAEPYALTNGGDSGGPLLGRGNFLLGVIVSVGPNEQYQWGNFSVEFLNQYKLSLHASVDYYRDFIESVTDLETRQTDDL